MGIETDFPEPIGRVARALWRLRSPSSQAKDLAQAGKSVPLSLQFEHESAGMSTLVKALIGLVLYLLVGIICFSLLQEELHGATTTTFVDAMYFAIVTTTTVGYRELVPGELKPSFSRAPSSS